MVLRLPAAADFVPVEMNTGRGHSEEGKMKCLNMYDVRLYDDSPACGMNWPPDLPAMYTYLRVRTALILCI